jgi:hypothetical protein
MIREILTYELHDKIIKRPYKSHDTIPLKWSSFGLFYQKHPLCLKARALLPFQKSTSYPDLALPAN